MFETKIAELTARICANLGFRKLETVFDDRIVTSAFLIDSTGITEAIPNRGWTSLRKTHKIYVQYKGNDLRTLIGFLTKHFSTCRNHSIISIQDDSKTAFNELNTGKEYPRSDVQFAYIVIELKDIIKAINCNPCLNSL